jgi:hypothetical protein
MAWNKLAKKGFIKKINKLDKAKYPKNTKGVMCNAVNNSPTMEAAVEKVSKEVPQYVDTFKKILGIEEDE